MLEHILKLKSILGEPVFEPLVRDGSAGTHDVPDHYVRFACGCSGAKVGDEGNYHYQPCSNSRCPRTKS